MDRVHWLKQPCWALVVLTLLARTSVNAETPETDCKFSFTHQQTKAFSAEKLKSVIRDALEYRIGQCRSIYYDVQSDCGLCDFGERMPTEFTKPFTWERVQCWAVGSSFRVDKERHNAKGETDYIRKDAFDADKGVSRFFGMDHPSGDNKYGVIDSKIAESPFTSTYIYWLNLPDQYHYVGEFFVGKIVANYDNWEIRLLPDGLVELQCNWKLALNENAVGKATYTLDPVKGFFPVACYGIWKDADPGAYFRQYEMRFVVDDSKLLNGLWMPIKLRDAVCPNGERDKGNLYKTTVNALELGKTNEPDVRLPFPEGTSVQDRIKGIVFTAGPNDAKKDIERLYLTAGADNLVAGPADLRQKSNKYRLIYLIVSTAIAIGLLAFVIRRRRLRSVGPPESTKSPGMT